MERTVVAKRKGGEGWKCLVFDPAAVPQFHADRTGEPVHVGTRVSMFNGGSVIVVGIRYQEGHQKTMHKDGTWHAHESVWIQHETMFRHWYAPSVIGAKWVDVYLPEDSCDGSTT